MKTWNLVIARAFGKCLSGEEIDGEVGDLIGSKGPVDSKLFTYLRYDVELTKEGLNKLDGLQNINVEHVQQIDSVQYMDELETIGKALAKKVKPEHFDNFVNSSASLAAVG